MPFLTQVGQKFGPECPSNVAFGALFAIGFHSCVWTSTTFHFKRYSPCKIWKKPIDNVLFLYFFHNIGLNLVQILPQDHTRFDFFCWFLIKYANGIQLILITLIGIQKFWEKLLKSPKITIFWPNKIFSYLSKYHVFWLSDECFSIFCDAFC